MPVVWIPSPFRDLTGGASRVAVSGTTVGEVIDGLDAAYPGLRARLCDGDDLSPEIAVAVDGKVSRLGLFQPIREDSEIHFLPAIGGGGQSGTAW